MPALPGGVIMTLSDVNGNGLFVIYEWFDPVTFAMRNQSTATSTGNKNAALIVDNLTGKTQSMTVTNPETQVVKTFSIPPSGSSFTANQLANLNPPNGPINVIQDLAGLSPASLV